MLDAWLPFARERFTAVDFEFLALTLGSRGQPCHLARLWDDPGALREMLDLKEVFRAVIGSPSALQISPAFYFYVLVRHSFLHAGLQAPELSDYVAGVLARRISSKREILDETSGCLYAADFLSIISSARGGTKFQLQVCAGDRFLVLTGLYPGFLRDRCERHGAPDIEFYEGFAQRAYHDASGTAQLPSARALFGALSEALPDARRSLNRMTEEFLFLGN